MTLRSDERGQAFPIYVVMVAGLLFAALALFVIGRAGAIRGDAQGAADAGALAAAGEARDKVFTGLNLADLKPEDWEKLIQGKSFDLAGACAKGMSFATKNNATATCVAALPEFRVTATTKGAIGDSVVPGTQSAKGIAEATAVIKPRCSLASGPVEGDPPKVAIKCDGEDIELDPLIPPEKLHNLARALFSVRLIN